MARKKKQKPVRSWGVLFFRILFPALLVMCLVMIFGFSSEAGEDSSGRSLQVMEWVNKALDNMDINFRVTHTMVRKTAHFLEYFLLGLLLLMTLRVYTRRVVGHLGWALFGGLLVPVVDETLQLFTPGRSGQLTDVLIDFGGAFSGIMVALVITLIARGFWALISIHGEDGDEEFGYE